MSRASIKSSASCAGCWCASSGRSRSRGASPTWSAHVETIRGFVEGWRKDAEADKQNLLVAARAVILRDPRADGTPGMGVAEIPLPVQVERALADAHVHREPRSDEIAALKMLPSETERRDGGRAPARRHRRRDSACSASSRRA